VSKKLEGKVALITGCNSGVGQATARGSSPNAAIAQGLLIPKLGSSRRLISSCEVAVEEGNDLASHLLVHRRAIHPLGVVAQWQAR
jgi:NAD(P)-dependent dehydrogenase (short-subunit alcohol dehydrogenase family)